MIQTVSYETHWNDILRGQAQPGQDVRIVLLPYSDQVVFDLSRRAKRLEDQLREVSVKYGVSRAEFSTQEMSLFHTTVGEPVRFDQMIDEMESLIRDYISADNQDAGEADILIMVHPDLP